tara:strand:- start:99327 stop:101363 length:2037 start_codon:yes stop_codon:yes gene_type:complete
MANPLIEKFNTAFETPPFHLIKEDHFLEAIEEGIAQAKKEVDEIVNNPQTPSFENTIEALEASGSLVGRVAEIFFNLNSAETNDKIQSLAHSISPLLTEYGNDIMLNQNLFQKVKHVYDKRQELNLGMEETMLLDKTYLGFTRNGALLNDEDKNTLREIDKKLSGLSLKFGENVLAETNAFELQIENQEDLKGLPEGVEEAAADAAKAAEKEGWLFNLQYPSYIPFVSYSENRALRKKMTLAFGSRAFKGDDFDNKENVLAIAKLRYQRAQLLGFKHHADYVLQRRMAENSQTVHDFLDNILEFAKPAGKAEVKKLNEFAKSLNGPEKIEKWDFAFYNEKLKQKEYKIDDEILKPYFKLENVIEGAFEVAKRLYGIEFKEREDIPKYHKDVICYEVLDKDASHLAVFYADFFPRAGKRNGAWMTSYRSQKKQEGKDIRPHISIVCNFTKPTSSKPSLLTFQEVSTLFHEFGHALHGILANGKYGSLSGTNVFWDFVELPSQIMENWCYEKECLDLFARHYQSGELIPEDLVEKLKSSATFMEGYATVRQVGLASLDMAWHSVNPNDIDDVAKYENEVLQNTELLPGIESSNTSCAFSHIFQGGYSAGYYSYKWAEVLDADAFEFFKEKGIFNEEVAQKFRKLLSSGGSIKPMDLYKEFRGNAPDPKALLRRAGLINKE